MVKKGGKQAAPRKRPAAAPLAPSRKTRVKNMHNTQAACTQEAAKSCPNEETDIARILVDAGIQESYHAIIVGLCQGSAEYLVDIEASDLQGLSSSDARVITAPVARGIVRKLKQLHENAAS